MKVFETPNNGEVILVYPDRIEIAEKRLVIFRKIKKTHPMSLVSGISLKPRENTVTIHITVTIDGENLTRKNEYTAIDAEALYDAIVANMPKPDGSGIF